MGKSTERTNAHQDATAETLTKKGLRFHATAKIVLDYQPVTKRPVAASRQLAPEVIIVMLMSPRGRAGTSVATQHDLFVQFIKPFE